MILTATILLSLKATSYCSQSQEIASATASADNVITVVRQNSGIHHDGTRDGLFGSGLDTLKNIREGKSYYGKPYGLGDNSEANWAKIGKNDIKTLADAQTFITEVTKKGWSLPAESMAPSKKIIQDFYSQPKKQAEALMAAAVVRLKAQEESEKKLAQQLRDLDAKSKADQETCNGLLAFDPINNSFATTKQLNDKNIRSLVTAQMRLQESTQGTSSSSK